MSTPTSDEQFSRNRNFSSVLFVNMTAAAPLTVWRNPNAVQKIDYRIFDTPNCTGHSLSVIHLKYTPTGQ
jgi:hypothetical protein